MCLIGTDLFGERPLTFYIQDCLWLCCHLTDVEGMQIQVSHVPFAVSESVFGFFLHSRFEVSIHPSLSLHYQDILLWGIKLLLLFRRRTAEILLLAILPFGKSSQAVSRFDLVICGAAGFHRLKMCSFEWWAYHVN